MKSFDIPPHYRSPIIGRVKEARKIADPRKKDFTPSVLDFGPIRFYIARHFGFCFGVENAIEISYRALAENPGKKIFLLSQMIHNPEVNDDLQREGIDFIMDTEGNQLVEWDNVTSNDIVIIPAFGTTVEIEQLLREKGIDVQQYNTTCPFVERVWKKSAKLGSDQYSIIIHGKANHEETRATFSHSEKKAPALVIKDMNEATILGEIISGSRPMTEFSVYFANRHSADFLPETHLQRIGVVNQTTMLASDTQAIADHLKKVIIERYGEENFNDHFADTRDTLCYATNDNQQATYGLLEEKADLAIVVGGYNSSNTSHIVELCEERFPTYFISSSKEIESKDKIHHFNYHKKELLTSEHYLPTVAPVDIVLTSGASCPDASVDAVLQKLLTYYGNTRPVEEVLEEFESKIATQPAP